MAEGAALLSFEPESMAHRDRAGHIDTTVAPLRVHRVEPVRRLEEVTDPLGRDTFRLPLLLPFRCHCRTSPGPRLPASRVGSPRKDSDAPAVPHEPSLGVEPDRLGEDPVLLYQYPLRERLGIVFIKYGHTCLKDDGAGVHLLVHEMDCAA